jgi:hypothetical protein
MAEDRAVEGLVEQAPDDDAGVVAVATNHLADGAVEARRHLRRVGHGIGRRGLCVDQQAELVTGVELGPRGAAPDEADAVEAHYFHIQQVAPEQVGVSRNLLADGSGVDRVCTAQEKAFPVHPEGAILETEVAETAAIGAFVAGARTGLSEARRDAVEIRVAEFPASRLGQAQIGLYDGVALRHLLLQGQGVEGGAAGGAGHGELQAHAGGPRCRPADGDLDADQAGRGVWPQAEVFDAGRRDGQHLHRVDDAAVVVGGAGAVGDHLGSARGLVEGHAVNGLMGGVEHAHGEAVGGVGTDCVGDIQHKRRLAALVATDRHIVQPDLGRVVHRPEAQEGATARMGIRRHRELAPVPGHPVIAREGILNDPRHAGWHRFGHGLLPPGLVTATVLRVRCQTPVAVQREGGHGEPAGAGRWQRRRRQGRGRHRGGGRREDQEGEGGRGQLPDLAGAAEAGQAGEPPVPWLRGHGHAAAEAGVPA